MASSTDSSPTVNDEVRQLYERYQAAESDTERHDIALEIEKLDGRRHAEIYAALETSKPSFFQCSVCGAARN